MSDTDTTTDTTDTPDTTEPDTSTDTTDEPDEWTPPDKDTWTKLQDKAKRRDEKLREAQSELAKLKGDKDKPAEPSEADKLREGMKRTATRTVLVGAGVTDKEDQATLLSVLRLDGVELTDDGEADTDELESQLTELRRILGATGNGKPRTPKIDTRDKGGRDSKPADPDSARYRRIMGQSR